MTTTVYGDISPRTAAFVVKNMLERAIPLMTIEKFGQAFPIPNNSTKTATFRRMFLLNSTDGGVAGTTTDSGLHPPLATTPLVEGVTPSGSKLDKVDISVTLQQYGDYVTISDVVRDTHEDPVLQQATEILGEQAAQTVETLRFNVLKAGFNVRYANGASRAAVNTPFTLTLMRNATRDLKRQNARMMTTVIKSSAAFNTEQTEPGFICLVHPDIENDIRNTVGYINPKAYGTGQPLDGEIGAIEDVRFIRSTIFSPFLAAGSATLNGMLAADSTNVDVYPMLLLAKDSWGVVPLRGKDSIMPLVVNPQAAAGDPLAQRGTVGWKTYNGTVILNDAWMVRMEVGATA